MDKIKEIDQKRIANILVYFAKNTRELGVTKANKLLYYLDCYHLLEYGRTVIKDKYEKQPMGPVPKNTYNRVCAIRDIHHLPEKVKNSFMSSFHEILMEYIDVRKEELDIDYVLDRIVPLKEFEPKWFSKSELKIMKDISTRFNTTTAKELVELTHQELPFKEADPYGDIDLKLFLKEHNVPGKTIDHITHIEKTINSIEKNYH